MSSLTIHQFENSFTDLELAWKALISLLGQTANQLLRYDSKLSTDYAKLREQSQGKKTKRQKTFHNLGRSEKRANQSNLY
ncbi:hypothetical protein ElyMa_007027400 [Elysia marginata]|uniref:Uncharacterized protein n=1 Tax=Elysia marginata TaxID=1093978 RepID=A0AAV4JVC9_9GAST|nr:hypothetical protein ElyMa_007027400 [Elysia marginata]